MLFFIEWYKKNGTSSGWLFSSSCRIVLLSESGIHLYAYPNPVVNTVTIKSSDKILSIDKLAIELYLMDMSGRLIQTFHTDLQNLNIGYQIQMGVFANGSYLVKVALGTSKFQVLPIIKSN